MKGYAIIYKDLKKKLHIKHKLNASPKNYFCPVIFEDLEDAKSYCWNDHTIYKCEIKLIGKEIKHRLSAKKWRE